MDQSITAFYCLLMLNFTLVGKLFEAQATDLPCDILEFELGKCFFSEYASVFKGKHILGSFSEPHKIIKINAIDYILTPLHLQGNL